MSTSASNSAKGKRVGLEINEDEASPQKRFAYSSSQVTSIKSPLSQRGCSSIAANNLDLSTSYTSIANNTTKLDISTAFWRNEALRLQQLRETDQAEIESLKAYKRGKEGSDNKSYDIKQILIDREKEIASERKEWEDRYSELKEESENISASFMNVLKKVQQLDGKIEQLNEKIVQLENAMAELECEKSELVIINKRLELEKGELVNAQIELQEEKKSLSISLQNHRGESSKTIEDLEMKLKDMGDITKQRDEFLSAYEAILAKSSNSEAEIENLQEELDKARAKLKRVQSIEEEIHQSRLEKLREIDI
ncbi:uncharacterized protein L201_002926 [Kwoniella dendrophila CBS 6074]|uniref:Uncharacterized protein n=1 Tax=Kwoniella dendrophila CBS 6074 TaxID=1295534 RepID=A0AAX4JT05_9TREE